MPLLYVCSLALMDETVRRTGAGALVTLVTAGMPVTRPASITAHRHLTIAIADISVATDGHVLAHDGHIDEFLEFVRAWDRVAPMVIHCYAGVSRSTAAAFIAACALAPARTEREIAGAVRARSPTATPNMHLVTLADAALGREGRMIEAVRAIGRGADCAEGVPFWLDLA